VTPVKRILVGTNLQLERLAGIDDRRVVESPASAS